MNQGNLPKRQKGEGVWRWDVEGENVRGNPDQELQALEAEYIRMGKENVKKNLGQQGTIRRGGGK